MFTGLKLSRTLFIIIFALGAYYLYTQSTGPSSAFSKDVLLFTNEVCRQPCRDAREYLDERVGFIEHVVEHGGQNWDKFTDHGGDSTLPLISIGEARLEGFNPLEVTTALAQAFGLDALTRDERRAYAHNFDVHGDPAIVMYSTQSCGYCKQARRYFKAHNIEYKERDIERNAEAKRDFDVLWGTGTPLIYRGYQRMSGFNESKVRSALAL